MNLIAGWTGILLGCVAGSALGFFFEDENWLGGYGSWRRRLLRLGHISFLGIGLLNLAFGLTFKNLDAPLIASWMFIASLASMPLVCVLSAWRKSSTVFFFIPVVSLIAGTAITLWRLCW